MNEDNLIVPHEVVEVGSFTPIPLHQQNIDQIIGGIDGLSMGEIDPNSKLFDDYQMLKKLAENSKVEIINKKSKNGFHDIEIEGTDNDKELSKGLFLSKELPIDDYFADNGEAFIMTKNPSSNKNDTIETEKVLGVETDYMFSS